MEGDVVRQSFDEIQASALRLINQNLDFDALIAELSFDDLGHTPHNVVNVGVEDSSNERTTLESLKLQASLSEVKIEVAASQMILKRLCKAAERHLIIFDDSHHLSAAFSAFKKIGAKLNIEDFMQYQGNFQHCLPLNVLLQLQEAGIFHLRDYLIVNVNNKVVLKEFIGALQQITRQNAQKSQNHSFDSPSQIAVGILSHLIKCAYSVDKSNSRALKKMCGYILFNILKSHLQHLLQLPASKSVSRETSIISMIRENLKGDEEVLRKCFVQMMTLWVTDSPNLKVSDAISTQHMWIASKQNEALAASYKEMALCIGLECTVSTLSSILERREVNWKRLLTFTSALLIGFVEARKVFADLIVEKLKNGIDTLSIEPLAISFLLTRQLSLEGGHAFTSYTTWFQENFGTNSNLISSNRAARFLIKFLTDIVPFEPIRYLKAHVIKPPAVPSSCAETLKEYATLARIRIAELGGSFTEVTEDSGQCAMIEKDVQKVLDEYKKTSKIPKSLMEASIFQKAYFCKKFLPALLKPRPLPVIPDPPMRLIDDLMRSQKIPKYLYTAYVEGCKKENKKLLEEVMILDDDSAFEDDQNPHEQFSDILELIQREISRKNEANEDICISNEVITKLSRLLKANFEDKNTGSSDDFVINLCSEQPKNGLSSKIVQAFLDWLGGIQLLYFTTSNQTADVATGIASILNVFRECKILNMTMCHEIWKFCTNEISSTSEQKSRGISLYLAIIGSNTKIKCPLSKYCQSIVLKSESFEKNVENWQICVSGDLLTMVEYYVRFYEGKESILRSFEFVSYLLQSMFSVKTGSNSGLVILFQYLGKRILESDLESIKVQTEMAGSPPAKCAKLDGIENVEKYQKLYEELSAQLKNFHQISIADFVARELMVTTDDDILDSGGRHRLYSKILFGTDPTEDELKSLIHLYLDELSLNESFAKISNPEVIVFTMKCLPLLLEGCEGVESNAKFIFDLMTARLECNHDTGEFCRDLHWENQINALYSLVVSLPTSFLFQHSTSRNQQQEDIFGCRTETSDFTNSENLKYAGKLINEYIYHAKKSARFTFTLHSGMTNHLVTGILELLTTTEEFLQFSIFTCPFIFISALVHWEHCRELAFFIKLRNPELHSILQTVYSLLSKKSAIILAYKTLRSKFPDVFGITNEPNDVNFCLACAMLDMVEADFQVKRFAGLSDEKLGYIAACSVMKTDITTHRPHHLAALQSRSTSLLQFCLGCLDPEYACMMVLNGKLPLLKYLFPCEENGQIEFSVATLRALSLIDVPQRILKSEIFLPTLLFLEKSISKAFSDVMLTEVAPKLRRLDSIALENAPNKTVANTLKRFPDVAKLHFEAERRKMKIFC